MPRPIPPAPIAVTPEDRARHHWPPADTATLYVAFAAGRRGAGSVDCRFCGVELEVDGPEPTSHFDQATSTWLPDDPAYTWETVLWRHKSAEHPQDFAEHQDLVSECLFAHPVVTPGREMGPIFGPFEYVEGTYDTLRFEDGETLACWSPQRGDWVLTEAAGPYADEAYSDFTIWTTEVT